MVEKDFNSTKNKNGIIGIRNNYRVGTTLLCYGSPHASVKANNWLEKKLLKIYQLYYYKVLWETRGRFWEEKESGLKVKYTDCCGGGENGNKN